MMIPAYKKNKGRISLVNHGALIGIYVIRSAEGSPCKVGFARSPSTRVVTFQTANWLPIELFDVRWVETRDEAVAVEAASHASLGKWALTGEWFAVDGRAALDAIISAAAGLGITLLDQSSFGLAPIADAKLRHRMDRIDHLTDQEQAHASKLRLERAAEKLAYNNARNRRKPSLAPIGLTLRS